MSKKISQPQTETTPVKKAQAVKAAGKKVADKKPTDKKSVSKMPIESAPKASTIIQPSSVWPFELDHVENWAYYSGAFSADDCAKIIEIGNRRIVDDSRVQGNQLNNKIRLSKNSWLMPNDDSNWIFRRVTDVIMDLNNKYFKFDLFGFIEGFQFTRYDAPGGKYDQHIDRGLNTWTRKLSFVLQLTDPKEYEGGDLELIFGDEPTQPKKEQGFVTVFPSYVLHRVTPVTKGTRYSLVAWITGPAFK